MRRLSMSVVVPTLNGGELFGDLANHLSRMQGQWGLDVLVIDSGSTDDTVRCAESAGLRVHSIPKSEFGHGRTRNLGVRLTTGEVVCFITQDVLPCSPDWPLRFVEALSDPRVAGAYGRQVPRDATSMEMFFVALNYPSAPLRFEPQPGGHHPRPGRVLFSNAFSAIRRDVLDRIPFLEHAQFSEDQLWARQALAAGYSIVYEPAAEALHAHRYNRRGVFRRSFEIGRALGASGIANGASLQESVRFLAMEILYFVRHGHTHRVPELLLYESMRWSGFHTGRLSSRRLAGARVDAGAQLAAGARGGD